MIVATVLMTVCAAAVEPRPQPVRRWNPLRLVKSLDEKIGNFTIELSAVKSGKPLRPKKGIKVPGTLIHTPQQ